MRDKKRVVLFNNSLSGGAGKSIITLATTLMNAGIDTHIIIYEEKIDYEIAQDISLKILRIPETKRRDKREIARRLEKELSSIGKVDMLISNSSPSNKIASLLSHPNIWHCVRSAETKNFHGIGGYFRKRLRYAKYRRLYNGKRLITVSKGLKEYIVEELGATPQKIVTIYNAFDFEEIERLSLVKEAKIPSDDYIIHVGRFDLSHKRQDILLEAYAKSGLREKLVLLGKGRDRDEIVKMIKNLGLKERVLLPGFQENPYPWIRNAKLFVFSSDFEGFARVLLESLSLGTPVVSTDCPTGPAEILSAELSAYLVPVGDSEALSKKMLEAIREYPKINRDKFSIFSMQSIAKEYLSLIEKEHIK